MKLLHIIASPRGESSRTIGISREFLSNLKKNNSDLVVDDLNLFEIELPEVLTDVASAKYALMQGSSVPEESKKTWAVVAKYSQEFLSYDAYLITSPMWNFTVPYKLKHYIDVIMQAGILFKFSENGVEGLAKNKKMFCVTSRGNDYSPGSYMHQFDFQEPYLRSIFGLAGIQDVSFINAQPLDIAPGLTIASIEKAKEEAKAMASK